MTSYHVVAPIILVRFQGSDGVFFRGWSPRRYGPAYTYDIVIEGEDNQHPSMNMEYTDLVRRTLSLIQESGEEEKMVDMVTDYHCAVPVEERGDFGFIVTYRDSLFSPVFFVREDALLYQAHLVDELGREREWVIRSFSHERV